jgi:hypothetical protein
MLSVVAPYVVLFKAVFTQVQKLQTPFAAAAKAI